MSHQHFCDFVGHYWECDGTAVRFLAPAATICFCLDHSLPMELGDHSQCSVELLSCPEHRDEQMRAMGYEPGYTVSPEPMGAEESSMFRDENGVKAIGFCLWCNRDFYTVEEHRVHVADGMAACDVFQALKDEPCMPPVLRSMLEAEDDHDAGAGK